MVSLKVNELRKRGYDNVSEWLSNANNLYIGRRMRIFIHTKQITKEPIGTKVSIDNNGKKILLTPNNKHEI